MFQQNMKFSGRNSVLKKKSIYERNYKKNFPWDVLEKNILKICYSLATSVS
jgi:hypothetical protein